MIAGRGMVLLTEGGDWQQGIIDVRRGGIIFDTGPGGVLEH